VEEETYGRPGVAIPDGVVPAENGFPNAPLTGVRAPVPAVTVYADILLLPPLATYKNRPFGSMETPLGDVPAAIVAGDVNAPVAPSIVNVDTLLLPPFVTYKKLPLGEIVTALGVVPAAKGDPATGVSTPVPVVIV
jgi:hypothetical protein